MKRIAIILLAVVSFANSACADKDSSQNSNFQQQAATGAFSPVDNTHAIAGTLTVEKRAEGVYLILNEDFMVSSGPDLRVVLRDSSQVAPMIIVDGLQAFQGRQEYLLPLTEEGVKSFDQVVIYCAKFHVDFGIAGLDVENN